MSAPTEQVSDAVVERVARALAAEASTTEMGAAGFNAIHRKEYVEVCWRDHEDRARAALSALPPRLSPELIAQLNALASRLTQMGEYEACDLIDTVVARVSAMPERELLREALSALEPFAAQTRASGPTEERNIRRARAAADKIRAALGGEKP